MPRPRAARPGSVAYAARPRRELTWVRPRSHGVAAGRRRPAEADARGASPFSTSCSRGAGRQRRRHSRPGTRYLRRREFPGARTPRPPSLLLSPPAPPLRSRRGRPRAGRGLAATCARPLTGTRARLPAWSAFRRGSWARGPRAAGRPGCVVLAGPTWRRGPGGLLRGREERAAPACGFPACPRADCRNRRSRAPPGSPEPRAVWGLLWGSLERG